MRWTGDAAKGLKNERKHGVSFADAARVFSDPLAQIEDDSAHEPGRYTILGRPTSYARDVYFVVYLELELDDDGEEVVHIISARHATKHERRRYEEGC
jgi:uncharacterized DUF497 family protein